MMFYFGTPRLSRKPSLTPMIDVVFLLLVFFMLAARFGQDVALALSPGGAGGVPYDGLPRLVEFDGQGLWLNGVETTRDALPDALAALMPRPDALIVLRPREGGTVQDLTDVSAQLQQAGFALLVVVEP
jgi:biopolymer transport protein ExbD